jgi:twitching motility protein PilT
MIDGVNMPPDEKKSWDDVTMANTQAGHSLISKAKADSKADALQNDIALSANLNGPQPSQSTVSRERIERTATQASQSEELSLNFQLTRRSARVSTNVREIKAHLVNLEALLAIAVHGHASDLLLKVGQIPMFRLNGELFPLKDGPRIDRSMIETMAGSILTVDQRMRLDSLDDVDASYTSSGSGRVRINVFRQRGELGMVIRMVPFEVPSFEQLGMGAVVRSIAELKRGLVLVTGATGSGKSTTLAAMIDHINRTRTSHIITIEDPVEYLHTDKRSMVNQRELGLDTRSFAAALRSALRQNPDVILVGELRDVETIEVALQAAETGHLVFSTMHTNDAADSMTRILSTLGTAKEPIVRQMMAENLRAVVSQRLLRRSDKKSRVAAQEILINTATIRERILKGASPSIVRDFIAQGQSYGMQTFDQHLFELYTAGWVDYEEAYQNATNRDDFDLKCRGVQNVVA